jgi:ribosome-associated heat shock protein Hsp15
MEAGEPENQIRVDKWLWYARFFKTRSLASKICRARKIRINGTISSKASATVKVGDVLTFPKADIIKTIEVLAIGERRGPASEAQLLYKYLSIETQKQSADGTDKATSYGVLTREKGAGRPTKSDRRAIDKLMNKLDD